MTTYNPITDGELASGQPVTTSLLTRLRDNILAIIQGDASAPKMSNAALSTVPGQNMSAYATPGTYSLVIPTGITSITFEGWGGGASGDGALGSNQVNGGAAEYRLGIVSVTPGETITLIVGSGGAALGSSYNNGFAGQSTFIKRGASVLVEIKGGKPSAGYPSTPPSDSGTGGVLGFVGSNGTTQSIGYAARSGSLESSPGNGGGVQNPGGNGALIISY